MNAEDLAEAKIVHVRTPQAARTAYKPQLLLSPGVGLPMEMSGEAQPSRSPERGAAGPGSSGANLRADQRQAGAGEANALRNAEQRQGLLPIAADMSRDELVIELEHQRRNVTVLQGEVRRLRAAAVDVAVRSEAEEEALANKLLKLQRDERRSSGGAGHPVTTAAHRSSAKLERQLQQVSGRGCRRDPDS